MNAWYAWGAATQTKHMRSTESRGMDSTYLHNTSSGMYKELIDTPLSIAPCHHSSTRQDRHIYIDHDVRFVSLRIPNCYGSILLHDLCP